ncbi:MAG TPA: hypothetical protein VKC89_00270 [Patescibacteria group bacterium]|nr:hypothetical protein [Patescibacteria group bacterium]
MAAILAVFLTNFSPSTFLIGWDNRLQELSPLLNLKRYIFSVWQEYQGLGLLAGHAHAAEIPHAIFIALMSIFLPLNIIRQAYVFIMLGLGVLGTYFLVKKLVHYDTKILNEVVPLFGGLFYLFNLATIQTFYTPLEPFITHYAALPWLILSALYFIANKTRKALLFFVLVNILSIPQAQIPTVFFVYIFALCFFLFILILETKNRYVLKRSLQVLLITLVLNLFWLLPFIYFFLTNSQVALEAKMNQMSTQTIFLQNKEFGNIQDVMLLKGFWFNNVDPNLQGNFAYMFSAWRDHLTPLVSGIGYLFFVVVLIGFFYVKRKAPFVLPFSALFVLAFTMLATSTPPFSWIDSLLRTIPIFNEMFRFPFTKFSILTALTYSFFFAIGIGKLMSWYTKLSKNNKPNFYPIIILFIVLLGFFVFPIFKGGLIYSKERINIPNEYFKLFSFLKTQDPNTRIANFPQSSFWGWNFYSWGYGGSGFLWYGINQPILDRAFDVWSKNDENYYWEVSYALYSKNPQLFENVLNKYQINYLLVDKNVINPSAPKALFTKELKDLILQIPSIKKQTSFGNLDLYKVDLKDNIKGFVFSTNKTSSVNSYNWSNFDKAYSSIPNYTSIADGKPDFFYPFRSLFSGKNEENKEFVLKDSGEYLEFSKTLPILKDTKINLPSVLESEASFVANFKAKKNNDESTTINVNMETPQIYIGGQKVWGQIFQRPLFIIPKGSSRKFDLNINGVTLKADLDSTENLGSTYIFLGQNVLTLDNGSLYQITITQNDIQSLLNQPTIIDLKDTGNKEFMVKVPKITDSSQNFSINPSEDLKKKVKNCENFRNGTVSALLNEGKLELQSENATACISFFSSTLSHNQGYAVLIENQNIKGRPLHFWILNEDEKQSPIDTYLKENKKLTTSSFILPTYEQFGIGYSINFENIAIAEKTINRLGKVSFYPIPYNFLTSIVFTKGNSQNQLDTYPKLQVTHPNESLYIVNGPKLNKDSMLVLSQAFASGWKAYEVSNDNFLTNFFPFVFGKELKEHVLVNNWENGWVLNSSFNINHSSLIYIVYLPQYLEYLGFVILIIGTFYLLKKRS